MATYMLHDSVAKIINFHAQLDQVTVCLMSTTNKFNMLAGTRNHSNVLHIPDIPVKHPGDTSHREANL